MLASVGGGWTWSDRGSSFVKYVQELKVEAVSLEIKLMILSVLRYCKEGATPLHASMGLRNRQHVTCINVRIRGDPEHCSKVITCPDIGKCLG